MSFSEVFAYSFIAAVAAVILIGLVGLLHSVHKHGPTPTPMELQKRIVELQERIEALEAAR